MTTKLNKGWKPVPTESREQTIEEIQSTTYYIGLEQMPTDDLWGPLSISTSPSTAYRKGDHVFEVKLVEEDVEQIEWYDWNGKSKFHVTCLAADGKSGHADLVLRDGLELKQIRPVNIFPRGEKRIALDFSEAIIQEDRSVPTEDIKELKLPLKGTKKSFYFSIWGGSVWKAKFSLGDTTGEYAYGSYVFDSSKESPTIEDIINQFASARLMNHLAFALEEKDILCDPEIVIHPTYEQLEEIFNAWYAYKDR
jgi:hypothetical protein